MSSRALPRLPSQPPTVLIRAGWDRQSNSFFLQVIDTGGACPGHLEWLGQGVDEITELTPEFLATAAQYADMTGVADLLRADKAAEGTRY